MKVVVPPRAVYRVSLKEPICLVVWVAEQLPSDVLRPVPPSAAAVRP